MSRPYLEISGLIKRYGARTILDIEELAVNRGELLAIIGPNGAGKSTLLRLIAQLEKPTGGTIRFAFVQGANAGLEIRRRLSMVFQDSLLLSGTVFDNIAYGLKVRKTPRIQIEKKVRSIAEMLGISNLLSAPAGSLSGGEAQRVSIARALILEPELLLLDEPMASLDPPTKDLLLADLNRILNMLKMTVIYVTHERSEAVLLADRLAFMDEGKVIQVGPAHEVLDHPISRKIADFVGAENVFAGSIAGVSDGFLRIKLGDIEILAVNKPGQSGAVWVSIRPEHVTVVPADRCQANGIQNNFKGTIENLMNLGVFYRVVINCGFPISAFITKQLVDSMGLRVKQVVYASFKAERVHIIPRESEECAYG